MTKLHQKVFFLSKYFIAKQICENQKAEIQLMSKEQEELPSPESQTGRKQDRKPGLRCLTTSILSK